MSFSLPVRLWRARPTRLRLIGPVLSVPAALALAVAAQDSGPPEPDPQQPERRPPAARSRLGRLRTVRLVSRLTFRQIPDRPHLLETVYAFPDRLRWALRHEEARARRRLFYRYGDFVYRIADGERESSEPEGADRLDLMRQFALRRAAQLWPDETPWTREGGGFVAELGELGRLRADDLDGQGRPATLRSFGADGALRETFRVSAWHEREGRHWPARVVVYERETPVADEELIRVEVRANFVDAFFRPPDRRERAAATSLEIGAIDLPASSVRRVALEPGVGWSAALDEAQRLRRAEAAAGRRVFMAIELDRRAAPSAVRLELFDAPDELPEGWTTAPEAPAVTAFVDSWEEVSPEVVRELREFAGPAGKDVIAFVRLERGDGPRRAQVVLRLGPD